jgi:hypothetical protein
MDDDVASAASQLFGSGPRGLLVIDARELLTSTARVVGAQLGELHFKTWMALLTLYVAHGMPEDGSSTTTVGELSRIIWGADRTRGGLNTNRVLSTLFDLYEATFTVPGYDLISRRPTPGLSNTRLLINLYVDETMLHAFKQPAAHGIGRTEFGRAFATKRRGTLAWRLHPDYAERLAGADLRRFDWTKAQQLRGVALGLWMVFTSPRVPYRQLLSERGEFETVEVLLTAEHWQALGVRAGTDAARRRTLNQAGRRVCAADKSFAVFEAHGGRGQKSFLRIVRRRPAESPVERPFGPSAGQLSLVA